MFFSWFLCGKALCNFSFLTRLPFPPLWFYFFSTWLFVSIFLFWRRSRQETFSSSYFNKFLFQPLHLFGNCGEFSLQNGGALPRRVMRRCALRIPPPTGLWETPPFPRTLRECMCMTQKAQYSSFISLDRQSALPPRCGLFARTPPFLLIEALSVFSLSGCLFDCEPELLPVCDRRRRVINARTHLLLWRTRHAPTTHTPTHTHIGVCV